MSDTDPDRRAAFRTFNEWISQLHWKVRFCHEIHPSGVACQGPLGHASLGETTTLRSHVGFDVGPNRRAQRVTWNDEPSERFRLRLDRHPASGARRPPHYPPSRGTDER